MLEIANVGKVFGEPGSLAGASLAHRALDGVNLSVGEHEIVSLVGTSGCGKSTLLRLVSGLDLPSSGRVTVDGHPVDSTTSRSEEVRVGKERVSKCRSRWWRSNKTKKI